jgi:hypothetical protein
MMKSVTFRLLLAFMFTVQSAAGLAMDNTCARVQTLSIRAADGSRRDALLSAGASPGLRINDAQSHQLLWSFGDAPAFMQPVAGMNAPFFGSFMAIDLDGDGVQDRIYAGDARARIWRIDLRQGWGSSFPAYTSLFAQFSESVPAGGFIAPPDVTLIARSGEPPWISIAIGTATLRPGVAGNRFYLLRDDLAAIDAHSSTSRPTLHETDLEYVDDRHGDSPANPASTPGGYLMTLGEAQVVAPSLTIDGRVFFTVASLPGTQFIDCRILIGYALNASVSVSALNAIDGSVAADLNGDGIRDAGDLRVTLPASLRAASALTLAPDNEQPLRWRCQAGDQIVADCAVDTGPHRTWWRREDAD